jgi:hypothetical protein
MRHPFGSNKPGGSRHRRSGRRPVWRRKP